MITIVPQRSSHPKFYKLAIASNSVKIVPKFPGARTHSPVGDWEVTRVEEYTSELSTADFGAIVICYCRYSPVTTPLEPLPRIQVSEQLQEVQS